MPTPTTLPRLEDGSCLVPSTPRGVMAPSRPSHLRWLTLLLVAGLGFGAGHLDPNVPPARENIFVAAFSGWTRLRERDLKNGTTGADTVVMWHVVKARFKDLDKSLNYK